MRPMLTDEAVARLPLEFGTDELLADILGNRSTRRHSTALAIVGVAVLCGIAFAIFVPNPFDLAVYRFGGSAVSDGTSLYGVEDPATGRLFTYPPFAALLFVPLAHLPVWLTTATWTALGVAALGGTVLLFLREQRVDLSPRLSSAR